MDSKEIRFSEIYKIPSSNGLSRPSAVRGLGFRMINMGELFSNDIINDMDMERVQMSDKEKEKYLVEEGDLLFARQSLVAAGAGKCSIVGNLKEQTTFESHLIRVRLDKTKANPWFYFYYFKLQNNPIKTIVNQCAQAGIRGTELARVKILFVDKYYQDKIAEVLTSYDRLMENNSKRIRLLEDIAEKIYKEWFVRYRFPGYKNCKFEAGLPTDEWYWYKLEEIVTIDRGISYSSEEIDCDDGVDLINLKNIQSFGGFRNDGTKKYSGKYKREQVVKTGDLVMGVTDMTQDRRTVGSVALIPIIHNISVISADLIKINSEINNVFLYSMFRFGNISRYISQFANGANVLHLRPQVVNKIKVYLPPQNLIDSYSKMVQPIISEIDILNEKNANLTKQRNLLLPRLMSGKLEIK